MTTATRLAIIEGARTRIELGWTRGVSAREVGGREIDPLDPRACRWCASGAVEVSIANYEEVLPPESLNDTLTFLEHFCPEDVDIVAFNDESRSKRRVLDVFDRAMAALKAEGASS
jgi:hypothetical protein